MAQAHNDPNVPKLAQRNFEKEQRHAQVQTGWMLEASKGDTDNVLTEDDRTVQLERERAERAKQLLQDKVDTAQLAEFLVQQQSSKAETLVLGKPKAATSSVLGDAVVAAEPAEKKRKGKASVPVVVVAERKEEPAKKRSGGGLSLLGSYQ